MQELGCHPETGVSEADPLSSPVTTPSTTESTLQLTLEGDNNNMECDKDHDGDGEDLYEEDNGSDTSTSASINSAVKEPPSYKPPGQPTEGPPPTVAIVEGEEGQTFKGPLSTPTIDFLSCGDGRASKMFLQSSVPLKQNISFSFNPTRKACSYCPAAMDHPVMGTQQGFLANNPGREVILLCDQSYPPFLPSSSEKK